MSYINGPFTHDEMLTELWRNHMVLKYVPSCITSVTEDGRILQQNPAAGAYYATPVRLPWW